MNIVGRLRSVTKPRWDGSDVLFEIEVAGRPVACAISRAALQEFSGCNYIASGDLLRRFADGRDRIEEMATNIFAMRPESVTGTLHIWAEHIWADADRRRGRISADLGMKVASAAGPLITVEATVSELSEKAPDGARRGHVA